MEREAWPHGELGTGAMETGEGGEDESRWVAAWRPESGEGGKGRWALPVEANGELAMETGQ